MDIFGEIVIVDPVGRIFNDVPPNSGKVVDIPNDVLIVISLPSKTFDSSLTTNPGDCAFERPDDGPD
jgi:hypothetical protein